MQENVKAIETIIKKSEIIKKIASCGSSRFYIVSIALTFSLSFVFHVLFLRKYFRV